MTSITIEVEDKLKTLAELFFAELGFDCSSAFRLFIKQAIRDNGIPFDVDLRTLTEDGEYTLTLEELLYRSDHFDDLFNPIKPLIVTDND
ncbi:MAG: type II toxin-antitoxin system RelB/DinJ family antitoxin [Firmicutes bacterium]|nr:type II toxin-antitoxin system RelB/DinJ family antitoxin [Bacillota bacterium]